MMQQVNLYLPELRPRKDLLNAAFAVGLCAAFVLLLFAIYIVSALQVGDMEEQLEEQQLRVESLQARVDKLKQAAPASNVQSLDQTIAQLELAIDNREKVGRVLSGQDLGNARGFHSSLEALARESREDLALDRFTLSRGGNYIEMHGEARNGQAVPLYLQRLKADPVLQEARFGLLSVSSEKSRANTVEFSLGYDNVYLQTPAEGKP